MSRLGTLVQRRREARSALAYPNERLLESLGVVPTASGAIVNTNTALRHADVYACVRVLADAAMSLPLIVYQRTDNGRKRVSAVPAIPNNAALLRRPSPLMTQASFVSTAMTHLLLWGNAFIAKRRDRSNGPVSWMGFIPPSRVGVYVEKGLPVFKVSPGCDDISGEYGPDDILHLKALSLDGVIGLSAIGQAREALGLGMTLQEFAATWFGNGSTPSGVINVAGTLTNEKAEDLRSRWEARHGGSRRGGTAVLEQGTTFQPLTTSMLDAQFLEQRRLSSTEVARIFRVPPWMIAAESGSSMTYSNVESQQLAFVIHSLRPWLVCIEQHLEADTDFFPGDGEQYPEFLMDAILRADSMTRANVYRAALANRAWMTPNEVRERENLDLIPGGDDLAATPDAPPASLDAASQQGATA